MILRDKLAVMRLEFIIANLRRDFQHVVRITLIRRHVARLDIFKLGVRETEPARHFLEIRLFGRMHHFVRPGDVKQAIQDIFQKLLVVLEHAGQLIGIGLVTGDVLLRQIEHPGDILHLAFRHLEDILEGVDFVRCHDTIGLGHFCAKRNDANRKGNLIFTPSGIFTFLVAINREMPGKSTQKSAYGTAYSQPSGSARHFSPNRHGAQHTDFFAKCMIRFASAQITLLRNGEGGKNNASGLGDESRKLWIGQAGSIMDKSERTGLLLGLVGVVIFGLTLPATRASLSGLDPYLIGLGRGVVAGAAAALILLVTRQKWPGKKAWRPLIIASAGVVLGFPILATLAMQYVPASHGGIVLAILPLATAVAGVISAGERPSPGFWLCSIAGSAAVLTFALIEGAGEAGVHTADLLLAAAVVAAAIGYAEGGVQARSMGGWQVICWALVIAAPILLTALILIGTPINWNASATAWTGFIYLALFSQLIGFFAWYQGMAIGGVAKVGQLQLLQTFVTLGAAALLLGEQITWFEIAFALLVVAIVAVGRRMRVS